ncbi:MAG: ArsR/SmtB family transcription factor [Candidatus Nanohaloarchaea archaeon]
MELDFKSVKALSSPTRIKILNQVLEKEATPTRISQEIGKSKSTVASHLEKLQKAGLVEKDEEKGRKRVTYSPTRKTRAILNGKERKVKFTLASSIVSMFAGASLGFISLKELAGKASYQASPSSMTALDTATPEAGEASQQLFGPEILLILGTALITLSVIGFVSGYTFNKLNQPK